MKQLPILAAVFVLAACGGDSKKKAVAKPDVPEPTAPTTTEAKPTKPLTEDQPVSPSLAMGADIAAACGIKPATDPKPTFDTDKDELTAADREVLTTLATCLTTGALKGKAVTLTGRADPRGTEEYNLGLGSRRGASVGKFLAKLGVADPQLDVTTRGAIDATGTDETSWAQDRRVDIQLKTP